MVLTLTVLSHGNGAKSHCLFSSTVHIFIHVMILFHNKTKNSIYVYPCYLYLVSPVMKMRSKRDDKWRFSNRLLTSLFFYNEKVDMK